jgi:peptidyl-prolyl cis-trans isomerase A (cyclophilin A)
MKTIYVSILLSASLLAQAPAGATVGKEPPRGPGNRVSLLNPASLHAKAPDVYKAQFTTTKGDFIVEVHRDWAVNGADRFYNLVKNGFYTDASFFRALPGFVVQFGMNAKPAVEAVWQKANIRDDAVKQSNKKGYVVFATAGPNTRTTQIFINLGDNSQLDSQGFAPFGMVVEGMDVVEKFYNGYGDPPRGPDQGRIAAEGKAYLDKNFPQLDSIKTAKIVGEPATAKPAATTKPATTTKPAPAKTTN